MMMLLPTDLWFNYEPVLQLPRQRELKRQPGETEAQIVARRRTLVCLREFEVEDGKIRALGAMTSMVDF